MTDDTKIGSGGALKTGLGYLLYQRNPRNSSVEKSLCILKRNMVCQEKQDSMN